MNISPPIVGPIIGHTTTDQTRIFIQPATSSSKETYAIIRFRPLGDKQWLPAIINPLNNTFENTAVMVLSGLKPSTTYEYQIGSFTHTGSLKEAQNIKPQESAWPIERSIYRFTTGSIEQSKTRHYLVGSCRYLNLTDVKFSDEMFGRMLDNVEARKLHIEAFIMTGDQIYADDWNFAAPDRQREEFNKKYKQAFSTQNFKAITSRTPCYMILDDHEIEDNWPSKATPEKRNTLYRNAIHAYTTYQCTHSPVFEASGSQAVYFPGNYWYTFSHGDLDWFVLDVRTERDLAKKQTINDVQMSSFLKWLETSRARVKFVVTPVMLYPDSKDSDKGGLDAWKGFPQQRNQILEHIRLKKIKNVIFITGDVHCALTSELKHSTDKDFSVHTIVSSPLSKHRLLPNATANYFELSKPVTEVNGGRYTNHLTSPVIDQDNYALLSVEKSHVKVNYYGRNGKPLSSEVKIPLK
ncbi:alkaline phosphatase family protein [Pseudomonas sp. LS1212]|uniref:alkaline phosphatase family protein n=1 Tax=Pseudomonas sp. LS1212 TaxID=2972478 RepID=UPI00215D4398|nr:alkaline phosphatase family protein [Pseudomonas sp. LS1212]UVJ44428.1 alkaline phosphatase family protein [Pseudomonas sp. LS1212]